MVTAADIREAVSLLDLSGKPVCVHSSLRSFGWVEGGASTVINGLLAEGCTVLVPTFSDAFGTGPAPGKWIPRNGWDYHAFTGSSGDGPVFTPLSNEIDRGDMGAIPATVLQMQGRVRGNHPLNSFTAIGPDAHGLVSGQEPMNVYAPLKALAEARGLVVLMGVGLTEMTFVHYAEQRAGRNPFIRWANGPNHEAIEVQAGGCSHGFGKLEEAMGSVMRETTVGSSHWRIFPARESLKLLVSAIQENPSITHCGNPDCGRCNDAVEGGPVATGLDSVVPVVSDVPTIP